MSNSIYQLQKRIMDIVVALTLLILFLPVWILVPILIKLDSKGPIFFRHKRVGKNAQEFDMYKFRSMVDNAHDYLHKNNPELLKQFKEADWKLEHDPRITRVGKIIRSITIDEFPQLINVLRGEMSMVGPRAYMKSELAEQVKRYPETKAYLHDIQSIKPGITGPWQVSGRNEIPFVTRAKLDAAYATRQSIIEDILIILRTPKAMFSKW